MEKISKILSQFQKENHYTYQKTADVLHMSKSSIYAYTNCLQNPTMKSLRKLADALNITVTSLLEDTTEIEKEKKFLIALRKEKETYDFLLEKPEDKILKIKKFVVENDNEF